MLNKLLYTIALSGIVTITQTTLGMDHSLCLSLESTPNSSPRISPRTFAQMQAFNKDLVRVTSPLNEQSGRILHTSPVSPQSPPSASQQHSPRKSNECLSHAQQKDAVLTGLAKSLEEKNKELKETVDKMQNLIDRKEADAISLLNSDNYDSDTEPYLFDLSTPEKTKQNQKDDKIDDQSSITQPVIPKIDIPKKQTPSHKPTSLCAKIIGFSAFTAIIIAILYKYNQLPEYLSNTLNKILSQSYAL